MIDELSLFYIIIGFLVLDVILLAWLIYLEWRLRRIFQGKKARNLEEIFIDFGTEIDQLISRVEESDKIINQIIGRLAKDISKCHTVRFNPFKDQGGNQSFATCLINDQGDGVVIAGLYSRDKVNIYAKPLHNFVSVYELSAEEKEAIEEARKK